MKIRDEAYYLRQCPDDPAKRARWQAQDIAMTLAELASWEKWEAVDRAAGRETHSAPEWVTQAIAYRDGKDWKVEARERLLATAEPEPAEDNWLVEARKRLEKARENFKPYIRLNGDGAVRA